MVNYVKKIGLLSAFEDATAQIAGAAALIGKGYSRKEAVDAKIGNGPIDCVHELNAIIHKYHGTQARYLMATSRQLSAENPLTNFKFLPAIKTVLPPAIKSFVKTKNRRKIIETVQPSSVLALQAMGLQAVQASKEDSELIEHIVNVGERMEELHRAAEDLQSLTTYPSYTNYDTARALGDCNYLQHAPVVIAIGIALIAKFKNRD